MKTEQPIIDQGDIARFHNQKEGDFNPETGEIYLPGDERFENKRAFFDKERLEKKEGPANPEKHLRNVILEINDAKLKEESKEDEKQLKLLEEKKHEARELVLEMLGKVSDYIDSIEKTTSVKDYLKDPEGFIGSDDFKELMKESDQGRKIAHDNLMDSINIANRFISNNFGENSDEIIRKFEKTEKGFGREVLNVQRIKLPPNIVCPAIYDIRQRKDITRWAMDIYRAIIELKPEIENYQ